MTYKRIAFAAGLVACLTCFIFARSYLLSASDYDLLFYKEGVKANQIHRPLPGRAYAIFSNSGRFQETSLCALEQENLSLDLEPVRFMGVNIAGQSYNEALTNLSGFIGDQVVDIFKARQTDKEWMMGKRFNDSNGAALARQCLQEIDTSLMFGEYFIFIVETVYYRADEKTPFMVVFKPNPLVLTDCGDSCPTEVRVKDLLPADMITRIKSEMGLMRIQ